MVGRTRAPLRDGRTRCPEAPSRPAAYPRAMTSILRLVVAGLVAAFLLGACSDAPAASFDPTGPCTSDGTAVGAYPDLEARIPRSYEGQAPEKVDSGRSCSAVNLGTLASAGISEVRFAGGTWSFGGDRAAALVVFSAKGLTAAQIADFFAESAAAADRTTVTGRSTPTVAGRPGHRIDTKTSDRTQIVLVWPSADTDVVNVVIANELPDTKIQSAVDAFGGR